MGPGGRAREGFEIAGPASCSPRAGAAGAPEGRRAAAGGHAGRDGMGDATAAAAGRWDGDGGRERGGGAARGRGAAAEEEEPGPPRLTAAGVNKPRRRGPAAAPARAGARTQADPCPGSRPGRGCAAAPPASAR